LQRALRKLWNGVRFEFKLIKSHVEINCYACLFFRCWTRVQLVGARNGVFSRCRCYPGDGAFPPWFYFIEEDYLDFSSTEFVTGRGPSRSVQIAVVLLFVVVSSGLVLFIWADGGSNNLRLVGLFAVVYFDLWATWKLVSVCFSLFYFLFDRLFAGGYLDLVLLSV
jgi:hypothetical protein